MDRTVRPSTCENCHEVGLGGLTFAMRTSAGETRRCLKCALLFVPMLTRSIATALVVGSILVALNQGDLLFSGQWKPQLFWKIPLTYLVPFMVATWGTLINARRE